MKTPTPTHREKVALFRLSLIGDLLARNLSRGELKEELLQRARQRYHPPGSTCSRRYSFKTLQRWYYAAKGDLTQGLLPRSRTRGFALQLSDEQRNLLLEMRKEHPTASAELLLKEAVRNGIVVAGELTESTLRRLFRSVGLPRQSRRRAERKRDVQRRRWQAERPSDLWHGDVCHLVLLDEQGHRRRVLIHGLLDDASRYCLTLAPRAHEREQDMLEVLCGALLRHPAPHILYLDNGACYRGDVLALLCQRLDIKLVHAQPYSPEARGKMERFWRTMRQRCTDHLGPAATLHQTEQALWAWLDADYQRRPHAALMGETPRRQYLEGLPQERVPLTPGQLAKALEVSLKRQVRKDGTFELDGTTYEVTGRHLAGKKIDLVIDALTDRPLHASWQDRPVRFGLCNPKANRSRKRSEEADESGDPKNKTPFDPIAALLQKTREVDHE